MKIVDLESISVYFLSYLWLNNRSLENLWTLPDMLNFLARNFSENCEWCAMFASCAFLIRGFQQRRNKNHRTGINNNRSSHRKVFEYLVKKKLLKNTTKRGQLPIKVWNFAKVNFFAAVFQLFYQHSSGKFCIVPM